MVKLNSRIELEYGFSVRADKEKKGKYPVFGSNGPIGFIDTYKIKGPGVIVGRKGSVGRLVYTKENFTPTDTTYYLKVLDEEKDQLQFWYYFLKLFKLDKKNTHSSVPGLSRDTVYNLNLGEIKIPDYDTQIKVAEVFSTIDEKIELNNKINEELERMSKMIFDYWFVQFDFLDENGNPYKTSGGKMEYNEELKREIPKGWKVTSLYDIATYTNGLPMQKHRPVNEESLPVIKIKEMNEGYSELTEFARKDIDADCVINEGDTLFSWSASLNVMLWADKQGALNQHIFKVTSDLYPRYFVYFQIVNYLNHFKLMAANRKTTMGHITSDHLKESRIVVPDDNNLIEGCKKTIEDILDLITKNNMQNHELSRLRDFLLPLLMNGQVKVS